MQDLEIYIRDLEAGMVCRWLESHVDQLVLDDSDVSSVVKGSASFDDAPLKITLYPQAFGKRYTSLIIEGTQLPWNSDLECARSAWRTLDTEVRCSPGEWKEGEPAEDEKWWRLDARGEQLVVWN
ncbi:MULTISPECIES: hypothetical protein [unclassified Marinobacter]|uniref:hypothetical protein n=1 Tax=unclassified Marinobacter TaxID=83889 RepID=UPI0026E337C1|nr:MULTISPECIES: hypothetical protein [unclassified Marinobacter]MDO6440862.1 hypothetical protein [Marinobacter sp. 2_MG-2023]MDO6823690.1 hypothetical protein [Marinobacter sp. 1_MG-2023]